MDLCSLDAPSAAATVGNRVHPSATVRDDCAMVVPMGCDAKLSLLEVSKRNFVSRGRHGTS